MNSLMRAQASTDIQDHKSVRCDSQGRLLIGSAGTGVLDFNILITTAPAYAPDDNVGGEMASTPAGAETLPLTAYLLNSVTLVDPAAQSANLVVLFFAAGKAAHLATITDNAPFVYGATTPSAILGGFEFQAADWKTVAGKQIATISNLGLFLKTDVNSQIYSAIVALGAPNFGNNFLYVKYGLSRLG
jgi:hypothetical protein